MELISDLKNSATVAQTLAPVSASATGNGASVDLLNADVRTNAVIDNGVVTGAAIWQVQMQKSADNVAWSNEADPNALSGQITASGITVLSYIRTGRYARAVYTLVSGTSSILAITVIAQKKYAPTAAGFDRSPST